MWFSLLVVRASVRGIDWECLTRALLQIRLLAIVATHLSAHWWEHRGRIGRIVNVAEEDVSAAYVRSMWDCVVQWRPEWSCWCRRMNTIETSHSRQRQEPFVQQASCRTTEISCNNQIVVRTSINDRCLFVFLRLDLYINISLSLDIHV